jgi:Tol biopolymer transport system component
MWSPTGARVGYARRNGGLYVGPADWSKAKLVSRLKGTDVVDWATDGSRFVFGSGRHSSCCWPSLNVSRADGTGVRRVWTPPSDGPDSSWINDASWSPTGRLVAVDATVNNAVASRKGGDFLYLVDPARRGVKKLVFTPDDAGFDEWSPDGNWLMVSNDDAVYKVSTKGGRGIPVCVPPCADALYAPAGASFAFEREDASGSPTLWIQNIDGSGERHVADGVGSRDASWSPDSRTLGFTLPGADPKHSSPAVFDPATGRVKSVTDGSSREGMAGVSVGGSYVAFYRAIPPSLWVVDTKGGAPRKLMTLASGPLGPCPRVLWSPAAPILAILNQKCEPS